jgi:hypothetical protein
MTDYPVTCYSGASRLQSELLLAFNLVAPAGNWKLAIDDGVDASVDSALLRDAVVHFTGSIPAIESTGVTKRVTAAGYYATCGA